jgi:hypothetical protein
VKTPKKLAFAINRQRYRTKGTGCVFKNPKRPQLYVQWTIDGKRFLLNSGTDDRGNAESLLQRIIAKRATLPLTSDLARSLGFELNKPCANPECERLIPLDSRTGLPDPRRRFCCDGCTMAYYNPLYYRRNHPLPAIKNCDDCSKPFQPTKVGQRFCNKKCSSRFHQRKDQGLIEVGRSGRLQLSETEQRVALLQKRLAETEPAAEQLISWRSNVGRPPEDAAGAMIQRMRTARVKWKDVKNQVEKATGVHREIPALKMLLKRYEKRQALSTATK